MSTLTESFPNANRPTTPHVTVDPTVSISPLADQVHCPLCRSSRLTDFFEVPALPVFVCVLYDSPEEARRAPMGRIQLSYCGDCGFVFNRAFEPEKVLFQPGYNPSLTHSSTFREFMRSLAERLITRYNLHGRNIIEVGCGEGYFLSLLANLGGNACVGFDPTVGTPGALSVDRGSVLLERDYYTTQRADLPCDFLCSLSVMEALPQPQEFVASLLATLGARRVEGYFEIYNGYGAIQRQQTWSILYEQCNYFSVQTFATLFSSNGFVIRDQGLCYESGEYVFVEALSPGEAVKELGQAPRNDAKSLQYTDIRSEPVPFFHSPGQNSGSSNPRATNDECPEAIQRFQSTHQRSLDAWSEVLDDHSRRGQTVVVWGSGGKGMHFLTAFRDAPAIQCVVDINPQRQGKFIPGTAHRIVGPEALVELQPDTVIITNPVYQEEIKRQVQQLGLNPSFLLA